MSATQGAIFVLGLAILPPAIVVLRTFLDPHYLATTSKTLLAFYLLLYLIGLTKITIPYFTSPLRHLPQPPGGGFLAAHGGAEFDVPRGSRYLQWVDSIPNGGLIYFRGYLNAMHGVLLASPEALHEVLVTNSYDFEKPAPGRKLLARTIGHGLINTEGAEHKFQRKGVTPAFSGKHIRDLVPLFWAKATELFDVIATRELDTPVSGLDNNSKRNGEKASQAQPAGRIGVVEINQWASRVTLDIIGLACVGRDFNSIHNDDDELVQQYEKILQPNYGNVVLYVLCVILVPLWIGRWCPFWTRFREASEGRYRLRPLCQGLIDTKRRDMETESEKHIDILSVLMRNKEFSDEQLVSQLLTFLAAGHETTSGAFTWTAWLLARHPDKQTRLRAELQQYFATHSTLDAASLEELPYLHACTSEQLRLWPTVPTTGRLAVRDTTILGQRIPKGTVVAISPWAINRSQKLWGADAEAYVPERWMDGNGKEGGGKGIFSLITFLHGPRSCIGQVFSRAELKCLVAAMILKFEVTLADPNEEIVPAGMITIKPKNGMRLRLRELV